MSDAGFNATRLERTRTAMQQFVETGDVAGCVTLVWRLGEIVRVDTLGYSDSDTLTPMTRDTLFRIASMTKPVTSVAALMLVEEGRIALDDPVSRWLPELASLKVLKDAQGPVEDAYPSPREITVE